MPGTGQTNRTKVRLRYDCDMVTLTVGDDGVGFDARRPAPAGHYGLMNMQKRARKLRGTTEVQSAVGESTTVHSTRVIPSEGSHIAFMPEVA